MQETVSQSRKRRTSSSVYHGKYASKKPSTAARGLCMALACVMVMSLLVGGIAYQGARAATAGSGQCGEDMLWEFEGSTGTLTIRGQGAMWDFESPEEAPWVGYSGSIRKIVFHSGITVIGKNAFAGCDVRTVIFPDTLTAIRENAFRNCAKLKDVDFSATLLTTIEDYAFAGCPKLSQTGVGLPEGVAVAENAFDKAPELAENDAGSVEQPTIATEPAAPSITPTEPVETTPTEPEDPTEPTESAKKPYTIKWFDSDGNLWEEYDYNADGVLIGKRSYTSDGNLLASDKYDPTTGAIIYSYVYMPSADLDDKYECEYDEAGRLIKVNHVITVDGYVSTYCEEFQYDETGKVSEWRYDPVAGERVSVKYVYDAEGNLTEQRYYSPDFPDGAFRIDTYEREYDEAGNVISYTETINKGTTPYICTEEYQYDEAGNLVEKVVSDSSIGQSVTYKYEFDDEGNLTGYNSYNESGELTGYGVVENSTSSTEETTEPTEEVTEPTEETTEPTEETTEPTEETTEPTEETTEPTEGTTEPTEETTEPTEEAA